MKIVDAQVHIWSAGPPGNPSHRQVNSYTAEECIRDMDAAGVDACILHPPGWDPNAGKISEEAAAKYPNRFAILGNFPLDKPENRSLIDSWKQRPGMLGLRYAFTQPHQQDDRRHDGLAVAGGGESRHSDRADGVELPAAGREDRRAPSRA
jgi:predicted TIM-barrel fold metal-dependent hydrolase